MTLSLSGHKFQEIGRMSKSVEAASVLAIIVLHWLRSLVSESANSALLVAIDNFRISLEYYRAACLGRKEIQSRRAVQM